MSTSFMHEALYKPVVTEKAYQLAEDMQYAFYVNPRLNKVQLAQAFESLFEGRKVLSVRVLKKPGQLKRLGRKSIRTKDRKKAIFHIQGEPLEHLKGL